MRGARGSVTEIVTPATFGALRTNVAWVPRDDEVGESFWAAKIRTALAGSLSTTSVGAWFGGMGSLNDEDQPRERA